VENIATNQLTTSNDFIINRRRELP